MYGHPPQSVHYCLYLSILAYSLFQQPVAWLKYVFILHTFLKHNKKYEDSKEDISSQEITGEEKESTLNEVH